MRSFAVLLASDYEYQWIQLVEVVWLVGGIVARMDAIKALACALVRSMLDTGT